MNGDPVLDRVARANPARAEQFTPDPRDAARLRSAAPAATARGPVRWRSVLATVAGVAAIAALVAVLPRGDDGAAPSPAPASPVVPSPGATAEVTVWLASGATPAEVDALRARLDGLVAGGAAESVAYVSAEDALDDLRGRLRDPSILDQLPENPMPASFEVRTSDPDAVRAAIAGDPAIDPALGTSVMPVRRQEPTATP